jgi:hypothetical protein
MNLNEQTNRIKQMMGLLSEQTTPMTVEACKALLPKNIFEEAKQWWVNWLDNQNTQVKFAYQNNLKKREVKSYIEKYKQKLDTLTLLFITNDNPQWINKDVVAEYVKNGNIFINCKLLGTVKNSIKDLLIHEIGHALNEVKPLVPYENITSDLLIPQKFSDVSIMYPEDMNEKLISDGLSPFVAGSLVKTFFQEYTQNPGFIVSYILNPEEIVQRLESIRSSLNKQPGENITPNDINDLYTKGVKNNSVDISDLIAILFTMMITRISLSRLLQTINSYTYSNNKTSNKV